jgi:formylglycine-generating enzyme required for sulfatase activity
VTNGEYRKLKPEHDSQSYGSHSLNGERQPVAFVNFDDASAYAEGLTRRERAAGTLPDEFRYRLPSEQEWQAFAQCGDGRKHPWGDEMPPAYGNYSDQSSAWTADRIKGYEDGFPVTCPVEKSGRNDWGLYGVGGNVFECCAGDVSGASFGAWRGASWSYVSSSILQCSHRFKLAGTDRNCNCGFRLVLSRTASPAPAVDAAQPAADVQEEDRKPGDATAVDLGGGVKLDMAWISPPVSPPGPSS